MWALLAFAVAIAVTLRHRDPVSARHADARPVPLDAGARAPGCSLKEPSPRDARMSTRRGRTFHVYGPAALEPGRAYPVVFAYHGWKTTGFGFATSFKLHEHVGGGAFVVYPDSVGDQWDLEGASDLEFFDAMRADLAATYCVDLRRLYAFGFSFGGKFVSHLACARGAALRAVAIGDGSLAFDRPASCARVPVLVTHRTADPDELLAWGEDVARFWARVDGCGEEVEPDEALHAGCTRRRGCGGAVEFCEDTYVNPLWRKWENHTVREEYREVVWRFFEGMR